MTRCANCDEKWEAKDIWSLFMQRDGSGKDCPHCLRTQYMSEETFAFAAHAFPFLFLMPFFVELSNTNPIDKYKKK